MNVTPFPLINAVINRQQEGMIYKSDSVEFIVFHKAGFSYISNWCVSEAEEIMHLLISRPYVSEYFHIYDALPEVVGIFDAKKELVDIRLRKRFQLKLDKQSTVGKAVLPNQFSLVRIDKDNFFEFSDFNLSIENKFWKSEEDFLCNGFGFGVYDNYGQPVSLCYSACVSNGVAEIDVITKDSYRQKGLALIVVNAFVNHCQYNNIVANWDCFEDNIASCRVAQAIGFKIVKKYDFLSVFNKIKNHEKK